MRVKFLFRRSRTSNPTEDPQHSTIESAKKPPTAQQQQMKLIPWEDIWTSLSIAQMRGNGDMIEVFYDTLFREAVFDDNGAWSIDLKKKS